MPRPMIFHVVQLGEYPATRGLGQDGRARLDDLLVERGGVDLTIDFAGVEVMNISFADEFLGKFLISHDFSVESTTVKVTGLSPDNLYSITVCVERRETNVVVKDREQNLSLLGDSILAETFARAVGLTTFKATELAEAMSLTPQNANNRLKRLAAAGALRKAQVSGSTRGGKEFIYEVVLAEVPDAEHVSPA